MKCIKCCSNAGINLRHLGPLCSRCFAEIIEKRVRKGLRTKKVIRKNDKILVIDDRSMKSAVGKYLLKSIIKGLPVEIDIKKSKKPDISSAKHTKIIVPWSLEDECEEFLKIVFEKKNPARFPKKAVKLLKNVSEDEIESFARIKKLKPNKKKKPKSKIREMLDKLEKNYPGYKFSLFKSAERIKSITQLH